MAGLAMSKSPDSLWRTAAMTKGEAKPAIAAVNELFAESADGLREIVRAVMQEMLEAEMTDALGAEKGERTAARLGYRSGYYTRTLVTRVGSSSCACRRTATGGSRPSFSSATSAPNRRSFRRWPRCTCRATSGSSRKSTSAKPPKPASQP
jgi:Transposase, Mutator family